MRIEVIDDAFQPDAASIRTGETVEWHHSGFRLHTVTAQDLGWSSGSFLPGERFRMSFDQPGAYPYYCLEHPWMLGFVVVRAE